MPQQQHGRSPGLAERIAWLRRRKRIADALVQVSEHAGETLGLSELLDRVCRLTVEIMPADCCTIYRWSARRRVHVLAADRRLAATEGRHQPRRVRFQEELATEQMMLLCRDRPLSDERFDQLEEAELYALVVAPLRRGDHTIGVMTVGLQRPPCFDEDALETLRGVASHAATLIENARLRSRLHRAAVMRRGLGEVAIRLGSRNDPWAIGRLACAEGAALFGVSEGTMLLREGDALLSCGSSEGATALAGLRLSLSERDRPAVQAFHGQRPVVVSDFAATASDDDRERYPQIRSMLAVPLVGRAGPMGCLVFADRRRTHRFSAEVAADGVLLAAIVAAALEHAQTLHDAFCANMVLVRDITERRRAERRRAGHDRVLELLAAGGDPAEALDALLRMVEEQMPGMRCSALVLDERGQHMRHVAAPSLPEEYVGAVDAMAVGPLKGSCGAAAYAGHRIIVEDVVTDARWVALRTVALGHGIRACWAEPMRRGSGPAVGVFAVQYGEARGPTPAEVQLFEATAPLVAIALDRVRANEQRQRHAAQLESSRMHAEERARELEQQAVELVRARDEALAAGRAKSASPADATHEIRALTTLMVPRTSPRDVELMHAPGRDPEATRAADSPLELDVRPGVASGAVPGLLATAAHALERGGWTMGAGAIGALRWGIQQLPQAGVLVAARETLDRAEEELRFVRAVLDARRRAARPRDR